MKVALRWPKVFSVLLAAAIAFAAGAAWAQDVDPRRLLPAEVARLTVQEINRQGLAVHGKKDYRSSADLFYYVTLLAPDEAYGRFNLACALSLLGTKDAAVQELRRALEVNRAWTEPNLKDPDLDPIRGGASFTEPLAWLGGKGTKYAGSADPAAVAWYLWSSGNAAHPVGQKAPDELGLYDMTGNAREWCNDLYLATAYWAGPATDPHGPAVANPALRVLHGGSWSDLPLDIRVTERFAAPETHEAGFRPVKAGAGDRNVGGAAPPGPSSRAGLAAGSVR